MDLTTRTETQTGRRTDSTESDAVDHRLERRLQLRHRHAQNVTRLMEQRSDLRGVTSLADFVDDAVRWTA